MNKTLVMENLSIEKNSAEIIALFSPLGKVNWVYLKPNEEKTQQIAYIEMAEEKIAAKAIVKWNGLELDGRVVRVKFADPKFDRVSSISGNPAIKAQGDKPLQKQLDVRDLVGMAQAFKAKKKLEESRFSIVTNQQGLRWPLIILIMILLSSLGYLTYFYTHK